MRPINFLCFGTRASSSSVRGEFQRAPLLLHIFIVTPHRYAADLTPDQKDALLDVVRANPHPQIGPEVRRELIASVTRGDPRPDVDGDVVMG